MTAAGPYRANALPVYRVDWMARYVRFDALSTIQPPYPEHAVLYFKTSMKFDTRQEHS